MMKGKIEVFLRSYPSGFIRRHNENKCYTEDNILVFSIYIPNVPKNITELDLKNHFSKFGKITSVAIKVKNGIRNGYRYGFVNFKKPESAALALKYEMHSICSRKFRIRSADSWKQRSPDEQDKFTLSKKNSTFENLILILNDDCLRQIFEYLSLNDQLKLSSLCQRFYNLFDIIFQTRLRRKDTINAGHITLMELRQMLRHVAYYIESVCYSGSKACTRRHRSIEIASKYCRNLNHLRMTTLNEIQIDTYREISLNLQSLTSLELHDCCIDDYVLCLLSKLPVLESLDVSGNSGITGKNLNKFETLKCLKLANCANIQSQHFIDVCKKRLLKTLNIIRCDRLDEKAFAALADNCNALEHLTTSNYYRDQKLNRIAQIKSLKALEISCSPSTLKDDLFKELAKHKSEQLTSLYVSAIDTLTRLKKKSICRLNKLQRLEYPDCYNFDDDFLFSLAKLPDLKSLSLCACVLVTKYGLLVFLENSTSIKKIDMSECSQFNMDFVFEAIDKLKKKRRCTPCTFFVGLTNIEESILEHPKYIANQSLLKLSFDTNVHARVNEFDLFMSEEDFVCDSEDDCDDYQKYANYDEDEDLQRNSNDSYDEPE